MLNDLVLALVQAPSMTRAPYAITCVPEIQQFVWIGLGKVVNGGVVPPFLAALLVKRYGRSDVLLLHGFVFRVLDGLLEEQLDI